MSTWTEERMEVLRLRWGSGFSATQIADMLNHGLPKCDHITRNAVIGKAHRLKLTQPGEARRIYLTGDGQNNRQRYNAKRIQERAVIRTAKPPKAKKVPVEGWQTQTRREPTKPAAPVLLTGAEKPWIERKNGECCYPIGEGADMLMCCQKASEATRNLCAYHFPICYVVGSAMKPRDVRHYERKAA